MDTVFLIIMIILMVAIIAALALYLGLTILELFKINAGLSVVLPLVGQIVAKTNPVNPVVDDINANLVVTRDALEGLMLKKGGPDSAGLVESLFPGQGAQFLRRVGRSGKVVNVGIVYTRGVGILASLGRGAPIGAAHAKGPAVRDPKYSTSAAAMLYPAPATRRAETSSRIPDSPVVGKEALRDARDPSLYAYQPKETPGARSRDASGQKIDAPPPPPPPPPKGPSGKVQVDKSTPPPLARGGIMSAKGKRPWEK